MHVANLLLIYVLNYDRFLFQVRGYTYFSRQSCSIASIHDVMNLALFLTGWNSNALRWAAHQQVERLCLLLEHPKFRLINLACPSPSRALPMWPNILLISALFYTWRYSRHSGKISYWSVGVCTLSLLECMLQASMEEQQCTQRSIGKSSVSLCLCLWHFLTGSGMGGGWVVALYIDQVLLAEDADSGSFDQGCAVVHSGWEQF
jgi:hypothetical protein